MTTTSRTRRLVPLAVVAAAALALSACASSPAVPRARQASTNVPFNGCDKVACKASLNGANYENRMPSSWNGTLLIYSHGYRYAQPAPPSFAPVETTATPAPDDATATTLLSQGYALAGSAYKSNGWAVADGVSAAEDLYAFFTDKIATPYRVEVWGDSLGGLITETIAEKHPEWVDGVAPFCGALAGVIPNMDLSLDVSYAVKTLIDPSLKLTGYSSYQESVENWTHAVKALAAAAADVKGGGTAKVLYIAALVDAPSQTQTYDGSTVTSKVTATVEALATALGYATFARYDLETRFGGNPSDNSAVDYAARISSSERSLIDTVTAGATDSYNALMAAGQKVTSDPAAVEKARTEGGDPQGTVKDPTITLHTAADPLVIVQNETFFRDRWTAAQQAGTSTQGLVQLYTQAPATYPEKPGAPYGAGHCNFTSASRVAVIDLLTEWVQNGVYPGNAAVSAAMGTSSGYVPVFDPGPWPQPGASGTGG